MFEASIDAKLFQNIIAAINEYLTDVDFVCSEGGISVNCMDSSHVALVVVYLYHSLFDSYRCDKGVALGLHIPSVKKILKNASKNSILHLSALEDGDKVIFAFENTEKNFLSQYELKTLCIDADTIGTPDGKYDSTIYMNANTFQETMKGLGADGDDIKIYVDSKKVVFSVDAEVDAKVTLLAQKPEPEEPEEIKKPLK